MDKKFRLFKETDRLAWFYILTGPDANAIGLYRFSIERAASDLSVSHTSIRNSLRVFEENSMVKWDSEQCLIWIPKWIDYNSPSGINQAKGYISASEEYLPHRFAKAFLLLMNAVMQFQPGEPGIISKKQAIVVRDDVRCVYCHHLFHDVSEIELDHVTPKSRKEGSRDRYDELVASCKECNQKKGTLTAEEFGFPFVAGRAFGIGEAVLCLIRHAEIRNAFKEIYHGLPSCMAEIDELSDLLEDGMPMKRHSNAVRTQEQEQRAGAGTGEKILAAPQASPPDPMDSGSVPHKERPKDEAYERFATEFVNVRQIPYRTRNGKDGDFVQLALLRRQLQIGTRDVPQKWDTAVQNYLASPLTTYTLADLCVRYDVFVLGEVDRFNRPAESKEQITGGNSRAKSGQNSGSYRMGEGKPGYVPKQRGLPEV
jgi:hypothetical protein